MKYKDFEVGDEVWCLIYGKGVVVDIIEEDPGHCYESVIVKFKKIRYTMSYGICGKIEADFNRTLFVTKRNVKEKDIKELYFKLLDEVKEVEFKFGEANYFVNLHKEENENFDINFYINYSVKYFNNKYISKEDADTIVKKMGDFIGNK